VKRSKNVNIFLQVYSTANFAKWLRRNRRLSPPIAPPLLGSGAAGVNERELETLLRFASISVIRGQQKIFARRRAASTIRPSDQNVTVALFEQV
jgi:hypothetical protein